MELKIDGMSCSHCQSAVQHALASVEGVQAVEVDLSAGRASVQGSPELEALLRAVEAEGYKASPAVS